MAAFSGPEKQRRNPAAGIFDASAPSVSQAFCGVGLQAPWSLAAPSCVLPAGVGTNCAALAWHFPEIGLAFFETEACLAYGEADLPPDLCALPVRWHMHLPLDLPWHLGPESVAAAILALAEKVAGLAPWAYVLHPPTGSGQLRADGPEQLRADGPEQLRADGPEQLRADGPEQLRCLALALADRGIRPESVLVENIQGRDLALLWPVVRELGLGVCLDLGHMLEHGQQDFLELPGLWAHTRMLHLNAPNPAKPGRHAALGTLDAAGRALLGQMLTGFAPGGTVVLELFSPQELFDSLRFVARFWASLNGRLRREET